MMLCHLRRIFDQLTCFTETVDVRVKNELMTLAYFDRFPSRKVFVLSDITSCCDECENFFFLLFMSHVDLDVDDSL